MEKLAAFPSDPGVYIMKGSCNRILYIGKAKNLERRVRQYFLGGDGRAHIAQLVPQVEEIETIVVRSEKEALLLENNLIKEHKPKYNVLLKDDKNFIALRIDEKSLYPTISIVRYRGKPKEGGTYFGPFTSAHKAKEMLDLAERLFPLRQCSDEELKRRTRPCILFDMGRCIAPCVKRCTDKEYEETVKRCVRFLRGKDEETLEILRREMESASEALEFEKAAEILKKIRAVERSMERQHVDIPFGFDGDIIGFYRQGGEVTISKIVMRSGRLLSMMPFHFSHLASDDEEVLTTFLMQHYAGLFEYPEEVIVPFALSLSLGELLSEEAKSSFALLHPKRGDKLALLEIAMKNAEVEFTRKRNEESEIDEMLTRLKEALHLKRYPERIECIDNSSFGLKESVSAIVTFEDGKPARSKFRTFRIKAATPGSDTGAMYEVLTRRFSKKGEILPDLLIVDGGRAQLSEALRVFKECNIITVDLIAMSKEEGRHDKGQTAERIWLAGRKDPVSLVKSSKELFLLQKIRDEAHRFVLSFQKKRRSKAALKSELEEIPGIGPKKRKSLLTQLGSLKGIKEATLDQLKAINGISLRDAEVIIAFFKERNGKRDRGS